MDHAGRRARLLQRFDDLGVDAFCTGHLPNVRYLSGFSGSNGHLVVGARAGVFLTDGRYTEQSRREVADLDRVTYAGPPAPAMAHTIERIGATRVAFEPEHLTYQAWAGLADAGVELVGVRGVVEALRQTKDHEEIGLIQMAQDAADQAFDSIVAKLGEGVTEREVAFELEAAMHRAGADGVAFDTIVAFGPNGAEPHHRPTDRPLASGDLVTMDLGALVQGYHSDMTRTVAFGEPEARLREAYEAVRRAQRAGLDAVRAGVAGRQVDRAARDLIRQAGLGDGFVHPVGHGVGLEIHEGPWLRATADELLPERSVVTVEPGVYLHGLGGIRIEDMVEVGQGHGRVLARSPKDLVIL